MQSIATTRMSSKGQVVIPEKIRQASGFTSGQEFIVVGKRDVVILKSVKPIPMTDFDSLITKSRKQARKYGLTKRNVADAIAKIRGHQ